MSVYVCLRLYMYLCMFVCSDLLRRKIGVSYADHVVLYREPTGNGRG